MRLTKTFKPFPNNYIKTSTKYKLRKSYLV